MTLGGGESVGILNRLSYLAVVRLLFLAFVGRRHYFPRSGR